MNFQFTAPRSAATGAVVLMACACGAGVNTAKLLGMAGVPATPQITHTLLLAAGAAFVVHGLWRMRREAAQWAIAGFFVLVPAAILTPPSKMTRLHEPWDAPQIAGALLYLVFAFLVARGFWLAFTFPDRVTASAALGGTALATGCNCCMVTGAAAGLIVTAGGSMDVFLPHPVVYVSGLAVAAVGLIRMAGLGPLPWIVAGGFVTELGPAALRVAGDWMVGGVNLRFIPGYMVYLLGAALIVKAWAVAYEPVRARAETPVADAIPEAV